MVSTHPTPDWVSWILPLTINHGTIILWRVYPRTTCVSYSSWQLFSFFLLFARERHDEQWNLVEEASKLTSVLLLVGDVLVFCYLLLILVWYLAYVRLPFYQRQCRMQITRNSVHKKKRSTSFSICAFYPSSLFDPSTSISVDIYCINTTWCLMITQKKNVENICWFLKQCSLKTFMVLEKINLYQRQGYSWSCYEMRCVFELIAGLVRLSKSSYMMRL